MNRIVTLTAVILTLMIVPTTIFALQNPMNAVGVKTPEEIAIGFVGGSPTFSFDGIPSSLIVEDVWVNKSYPPQYVVTVGFVCLHGGYGDRTGQPVTMALTPHKAVVTILDGEVISAVIDGRWDEIKQEPVADEGKAVAEAIALNWLINAPTFKFDGVEGSVRVVDSWLAQTFAPPAFWGVVIEFDCLHAGYGDRTGQMLAQVITHHVVTIHVTEGVVTLAPIDDVWDELKQERIGDPVIMPKLIYTPDIARKMCLEYLIEKHPEVAGEIPLEWTERNLVPEGVVGATRIEYTSGGWTVVVSAPVVWMPTHTVSISYSGEGSAFTWEGTLPQGGPVVETSFSK